MTKSELMKRLLDLYEQRKYVYTEASQMIVDQYIRKLELKLKDML